MGSTHEIAKKTVHSEDPYFRPERKQAVIHQQWWFGALPIADGFCIFPSSSWFYHARVGGLYGLRSGFPRGWRRSWCVLVPLHVRSTGMAAATFLG